jgi:hypothetical protein
MIVATTIFTIACLVTVAVIIYFSIIRNRSPFTGTTPIVWWIVGLGISQLFLLGPFITWWSIHQNILNGSLITAVTCAIIWIIIWIAQQR